jgi:ribulose kinase
MPWQKLITSVIGEVDLFHETNIACMGAAALGGVAIGVWSDLKEASRLLCSSEVLPADNVFSEFYEKKYTAYLNSSV